jgi:hypothetical protein
MTAGAIGGTARATTRVTVAGRSIQTVRQNISGGATTYGLDVGATLLPWLPQPSFDAANATLVIPVDTTGTSNAAPDAVRVAATYRRTDTTFNWVVFAPAAKDIKLPTLPPELADIAPTDQDTVTVTSAMFEADTVMGYAAVRNDLNAAFRLYAATSTRYPANTVRNSTSPVLRILL